MLPDGGLREGGWERESVICVMRCKLMVVLLHVCAHKCVRACTLVCLFSLAPAGLLEAVAVMQGWFVVRPGHCRGFS